jgi:hypothetical protein
MCYRDQTDQTGDGWAGIIDVLTMHPEKRRRVARLVGEIEAGSEDSSCH